MSAIIFSELQQERKVDNWNLQYRPGVLVDVTRDSGEVVVTTTTTEAQFMCGQAVIWLAGFRGCYSLDAVKIK